MCFEQRDDVIGKLQNQVRNHKELNDQPNLRTTSARVNVNLTPWNWFSNFLVPQIIIFFNFLRIFRDFQQVDEMSKSKDQLIEVQREEIAALKDVIMLAIRGIRFFGVPLNLMQFGSSPSPSLFRKKWSFEWCTSQFKTRAWSKTVKIRQKKRLAPKKAYTSLDKK